jgi:hypothetical protein
MKSVRRLKKENEDLRLMLKQLRSDFGDAGAAARASADYWSREYWRIAAVLTQMNKEKEENV